MVHPSHVVYRMLSICLATPSTVNELSRPSQCPTATSGGSIRTYHSGICDLRQTCKLHHSSSDNNVGIAAGSEISSSDRNSLGRRHLDKSP